MTLFALSWHVWESSTLLTQYFRNHFSLKFILNFFQLNIYCWNWIRSKNLHYCRLRNDQIKFTLITFLDSLLFRHKFGITIPILHWHSLRLRIWFSFTNTLVSRWSISFSASLDLANWSGWCLMERTLWLNLTYPSICMSELCIV